MTRKILKRLVLCVTAVAIAMGISVPATATSGFCTPSESFDVDEAYTWIYSHLSYPNLNDADKQELIEDYLGMSEFIMQYQHNREAALNTIVRKLEIDERNLEAQNQQITRDVTSSGNLFSCPVNTSIVQENETWCGVASTLMVLTGISINNDFALNPSYVEPTQTQISTHVIPNGQNTAYVYLISEYLNSQLKDDASNHYAYDYVGSSTTVTQLTNYIKYSLAADRPVILLAAPYEALSYYDGCGIDESNLHYIVIDGYDRITNTFWVADCTYIEAYQGRHYNVAAAEILECVEDSYIIYA